MRNHLFALLLLAAVPLSAPAAEPPAADGWKSLFDGKTLDGWHNAVPQLSKTRFTVAGGNLVATGPEAWIEYLGSDGQRWYGDFAMETDVLTEPGAKLDLVFHRPDWRAESAPPSIRVRINNSRTEPATALDMAKTGSVLGRRHVFKPLAKDGEWFKLGVSVCGGRVSVAIDGVQVVDYPRSADPRYVLNAKPAIESCPGHTKASFKNLRVKMLPLSSSPKTPAAAPDAIDREIAQYNRDGFPLIDFHIHLKGGLTAEQAIANSQKVGIFYGIAANCGLKFPITDDRGIEEYVKRMSGRPAFVGMQAEGREWPTLFSKEALARFDYVFTDGMTIVDHRGRRARLWFKDEVDMPDTQAFMELLTRTIVDILNHEPIDIYVNPTYLPDVIAKDYDTLWTPERLRKIIDAAAARHVAIEISNKLHLPKPDFIRQAKLSGIKFTFGTNNVDGNLGRNEYGLQMIRECGLTWRDMWMPKSVRMPAGK
jgi:hypothetical protein